MRMYFDFSGDYSKVDQEELCFGTIEFDTNGKHYIVDCVGEVDYDFEPDYIGGRFKGDIEQLGLKDGENPLSYEELVDVIMNMDKSTFRYNIFDDGETADYDTLEVTVEFCNESRLKELQIKLGEVK